jgi:hypothetical protein
MGACGAGCGITRERERDKTAALDAARRAYPGLVWSAHRSGPDLAFGADAIRDLGASLQRLLPVRAIPRLAEGSGCDWLYLLAGLHGPSLLELCDEASENRRPFPVSLPTRETYLRVGFSPVGPFVTLQEVILRATRSDASEVVDIEEEPVLGVEDRRLQSIVKGLQGALRKARLVVLDMAFLVDEVSSPDQAEFASMYGGAPTRWSFLFEGVGPMTPRATSLELPRGRP